MSEKTNQPSSDDFINGLLKEQEEKELKLEAASYKLVIDIETIPSLNEKIVDAARESYREKYMQMEYTEDKRLKDPEKIRQRHAEFVQLQLTGWKDEFEKDYASWALDPFLAQINMIGYMLIKNNKPVKKGVLWAGYNGVDEKRILEILEKMLFKSNKIIGYNIRSFDLRIIENRMRILQVGMGADVPYYAADDMINYFTWWDGRVKKFKSLNDACMIFGVETPKQKMNFNEMFNFYLNPELWEKEKHQEYLQYCMNDVEITWELYKKMEAI